MIDLDRTKSLHFASAILALGSLAAMALLAIERGPWLDEFFTIWMTDPAISLETIYPDRWATDLHPPMYYALIWAWRHMVADDLTLLRLANAFPLLIIIPTIIAWHARRPRDPWGPVYVGLVCCCPYFVAYFAELRSYFYVICITAALMAQLHILRWRDQDVSTSDWRFCFLVACTILMSVNLHFSASAVVAIIIGVEVLRFTKERRWRSIGLLVAPLVFGLILLVVSLAYLLTKTRPFALFSADPLTYLKVIASGALLGFALNAGVNFAMILSLLRGDKRDIKDICWSAVGLGAAMAFLMVQGILGNSLTLRYALVLIPPAARLAADIGSGRLVESRVSISLFFVGGAALLIAVTAHQITNKRWLTMVEPIESAIRDCPHTLVIAIDHHPLIPPEQLQVAGATEVFSLGYRWISERRGFNVIVTSGANDTVVRSSRCSTLIWSAHDFGSTPDPLEVTRQARIRFENHDPRVVSELHAGDQRLIELSPSK